MKPANTAKRVGVPASTVRHFLSSYERTHMLFPPRGRPSLERDSATIVVPLGEDPFLTLRRQAVGDALPLSAIYKARLENHYRFYKTVPVPSLKQHHKDARVRFCHDQINNPFPFPIVFSDESTVEVNLDRLGLWRIRGHHIPEENFQQDAHPEHVMIWGAIGPGGWRSPLKRCPPSVTREAYLELLCGQGIITMMQTAFPNGFIFQQDNASPHTAAVSELQKYILLLNWPSKSPDLSPIEQIWAYLKKRLKGRLFTTADELFAALEAEWNAIPNVLIDKFWSSFPARCQVCANLGGECLNGHWKEVHALHHPNVAAQGG
jgi:hypothetical protein